MNTEIELQRITRENYDTLLGLPANVLVVQGGSKYRPRGNRMVGVVVHSDREGGFRIQWMNGEKSKKYWSVGMMLHDLDEGNSFFYIKLTA